MGSEQELTHFVLLSILVFCIPWLATSLVPVPAPESEGHAPKKDDKGRFVVLDTVRGIAILAVILIHVTYFLTPNSVNIPEVVLHSLNAVMRFAIPVFLIASGILLRAPERTLKSYAKFYWDKITRVGVPYLLVAIPLALSQGMPASEVPYNLLTGDISTPFYFVVVLFQLYIIYPLLEPYARKRRFVYFSLAVVFVSVVFPYWWYFHGIPTFIPYVFFFVWGIYMRHQLIEQGRVTFALQPWLVMTAVYFILFTIFPAHYYNTRLYYGTAVFVLLYTYFSRLSERSLLQRTLAGIGRQSIWIFLLHFPLMAGLFAILLSQTAIVGIPLLLISCALSVGASLIVSYLTSYLYRYAIKILNPLT